MTTTNIKFNFLGNFADFMQLIGGHERSLGLSHELASGKNSDTLIQSITPCSDAGVQMVWEGNAQDIAEAMSNLWQHLLHEEQDEALTMEISKRTFKHWWCDLEDIGCEDPEAASEADMLKLINCAA